MKKTLAAVAVLGAFAGSALAADVTLYGRVNLGVQYMNVDDGKTETDSWGLQSGNATGSRFGIKGSEQISEGLTVGFQLEQGFSADNGAESDSTKAFSRESRLYVQTDFGTLHMGRFGALDSGTGSVDIAAGLTVGGTGYGENILDQSRVFKTYSRLDNSIAYTSPEFAGMKLTAMVSLGNDTKVPNGGIKVSNSGIALDYDEFNEASSNVDRYYALGLSGQWGALGAGLVVSQVDKGHDVVTYAGEADVDGWKLKATEGDDGTNVTAGVNYDFGVAKVYLAGNYYKAGEAFATTYSGDWTGAETETVKKTDVSSWGVSTTLSAPLAAGTLQAGIGYGVATDDVADVDTKILNVGAYYKYPLSKRTYVYVGAGYDQVDEDGKDKVKTTEVISGIAHHF